jgi:hypothetical protein
MKPRASIILIVVICAAALTANAQARSAGAAIVAVDEPSSLGGSGGGYAGGSSGVKSAEAKGSVSKQASTQTRTASKSRTAATKPAQRAATPRPVKAWDGFVVGDKYTFLNFEVVSAEKPYYTRAAKASGAKGLVQVEITIDQSGNVITAHARTGNKELHPEAERAALASKFNRPTFGGKPAHAIGFLVYRFGPADNDD